MPSDQTRTTWYSRAAWIALILVVSLAITDAVLAPTPAPEQPGFIDAILASRAVIAALRIAIVFAALFVALSVVALIARRQWLTRVGPVEVEEVKVLDMESGDLEERVKDAFEAIEALEERAAYAQQLIDRETK